MTMAHAAVALALYKRIHRMFQWRINPKVLEISTFNHSGAFSANKVAARM